jgi:dipeptidase E
VRLFLSSESVGNYPDVLLRMVGANKKLAYIPNARDDWTGEDSANKTDEHRNQFRKLGFEFEDIDLRTYFGKPMDLESKLNGFGLVWAPGGNTFILRRAMKYSGFDEIIKKMLAEDTIAYGGSSAGSMVMMPSLHGSENDVYDSPNIIPEGYSKEIIWDGLNLVPFYIAPHYKSDWYGTESQKLVDYFKPHSLPYYALKDGQVIVIDNGKEELLK